MTNKEAKAIKIGEASNQQLKHVINLQLIKLGVSAAEMPDQVKNIVIQWLKKHWPGISLFQFNYAFNLAINHRLNVDPACYGKFTVEYCGRILSAYIRYEKAVGNIKKPYDAEREFQNNHFDKSKLTSMTEEVQKWIAELKAKKTIK
jgi:hypothetical protein